MSIPGYPTPGRPLRAACGAAFALLLWGLPTAAAGVDAGAAFLADVAGRYASVRTLKARFRQEVPLKNVGIVRKASGEVRFERPLRMRWDYDGPDAPLFLADGDSFYFRPSGSARVYRKKIDERSLGGKIPLLLLFGKGEITGLFRVEEMFRRQGDAETVLRLSPRGDGAPEVRRIDMVVGTKDLLVRELHVYDKVGGVNHLYLEGTELDVPVPAGTFRFRNVPGTEVVDG